MYLSDIESNFAYSYIECFPIYKEVDGVNVLDPDARGLLQYVCNYSHILVDCEVSDLSDGSDRLDFAGQANQLCFVPELPLEVSQGISIFKSMIRNAGYYDVPDYRSSYDSVRAKQQQYQIVLIITGNK
jgi:hypothetical protein